MFGTITYLLLQKLRKRLVGAYVEKRIPCAIDIQNVLGVYVPVQAHKKYLPCLWVEKMSDFTKEHFKSE